MKSDLRVRPAAPAFVVVGGSSLAVRIALALERAGHTVSVVAEEPALLGDGERFHGEAFTGAPLELAALERAGIAGAHGVLAATGRDEQSLIVALVARRLYGTARAIACVESPAMELACERLGIEPLSTPRAAASELLRHLERPAGARATPAEQP